MNENKKDFAIKPNPSYQPSENILNSLNPEFKELFLNEKTRLDGSELNKKFEKDYFGDDWHPQEVRTFCKTLENFVDLDKVDYDICFIFPSESPEDIEVFYFFKWLLDKYTIHLVDIDYKYAEMRLKELNWFDYSDVIFLWYAIQTTYPDVEIESKATVYQPVEIEIGDILKK
jgi:hypothetical protein